MSEHPKIAPFGRRRGRVKARPPDRPEWLRGEAGRAWDELAPEMTRQGWLDELSAFGFAVICDLSAEYQRLSAEAHRLGADQAAAWGVYTASLAIAAELREWQGEFFMTPGSRAKLGVEFKPEPGA